MFFKTQPDSPQRYRIGAWQHGQLIFDVTTDQEMFNVTDIQPLDDEILLVCPRCRRNSESDIEQNGRIYGRDGEFKRSLLFGDGIRDVQVTADQKIWVSYFDEGIFGNYGWNSPLGSSGLVAWAPDGAKLYEFSAPAGVGSMADCYALNVPSNLDAWCYYYDEFPLVHIQNFKIAGVWRVDVAGAHAFAVQDELVLFHGSYDDPEVMHLIELRDAGRTREIGQFRLVDEEGTPMKAERVVGRGSHLYIAAGKEVFSVEVGACLEAG